MTIDSESAPATGPRAHADERAVDDRQVAAVGHLGRRQVPVTGEARVVAARRGQHPQRGVWVGVGDLAAGVPAIPDRDAAVAERDDRVTGVCVVDPAAVEDPEPGGAEARVGHAVPGDRRDERVGDRALGGERVARDEEALG